MSSAMNTLRVVQRTAIPTTEKKKRVPNCFILFRQEKMKERPHNITMVEYSKLVGAMWHKLSQDEKDDWKRRYEIHRDCLSLDETSYSHDRTKILFMNEVENYINRCGVNTPEFLLTVYYEIYLYNFVNSGSFEDFIMSFFFN